MTPARIEYHVGYDQYGRRIRLIGENMIRLIADILK